MSLEATPNGGKRARHQREEDMAEIVAMYAKGKTFREIARDLATRRPYTLSSHTVMRDHALAMALYKRQMTKQTEDAFVATVAQYDQLIREAWDGYERSKTPRVITDNPIVRDPNNPDRGIPDRTKGNIRRVTSDGDPTWLARVQAAVEAKSHFLGVAPPIRAEVDVKSNGQQLQAGAIVVLPSNGFEERIAQLFPNEPAAPIIDVPQVSDGNGNGKHEEGDEE